MLCFVFAGTADGNVFIKRLIERALADNKNIFIHVWTATEYGKEILENEIVTPAAESAVIETHNQRLDEAGMIKKITEYNPQFIVDCTHPYAEDVSRNILCACKTTNTKYFRLQRGTAADIPVGLECYYVNDMKEAAEFFCNRTGNILLTTGSKNINCFNALAGRTFPRVLPLEDSIKLCKDAGIPVKNIIAMQGPFTKELNCAMIRSVNAEWLVTKETGREGGFSEKLDAANDAHIKVVIVRPPEYENGLDLKMILQNIFGKADTMPETMRRQKSKKNFFPLYTSVENKTFLIAGAGTIAARRTKALLKFNCTIKIIAKNISVEILELASHNGTQIVIMEKSFESGSCNADFVIAATNDRKINKMIGDECREKNIPVSIADCREESTFYFPAIFVNETLTVGITSDGNDHKAVSEAGKKIETVLGGYAK
ncbi:hypothetical protein AGMMS50212_10810 [Spirochaetia bacterium]|nr:hypothetical protein AGMMS50212_10810 [Spirochaetia bacterium]